MKTTLWLAGAFCLGMTAAPAAQGRGNTATRFPGMDVNGDGVITRDEWRGSDQSFKNHDWNGDNKLSGDEIRVGARRANRWDDRDIEQSVERENDWTPARFRVLDHNHDGRLSREEWHASDELFRRIDRNHDNVISAAEFADNAGDDREDRFADLDVNRDGRVTRDEWHGTAAVFAALDANRDGVLTREEALGTEGTTGTTRDEFKSVDVDGDGFISRAEWHWNTAAFDRLDTDHDRRLSRQEFDNSTATVLPQQTPAYRAGYERGRQEGVQAGREDKPRHWDLEGQRELETADSGYETRMGNRSEYQTGYRVGFRQGYREGFGPR
jgi:Ca2+-binding EF-hand superfamily protein